MQITVNFDGSLTTNKNKCIRLPQWESVHPSVSSVSKVGVPKECHNVDHLENRIFMNKTSKQHQRCCCSALTNIDLLFMEISDRKCKALKITRSLFLPEFKLWKVLNLKNEGGSEVYFTENILSFSFFAILNYL